MSATTPLARFRAVAYARYSSEQLRAASIEDQLRNCRRRADDEGWVVVREFADRAISGADSSRPQYREMLSVAELGQFDVLLIDDLSRLARDQVESERCIRGLEPADRGQLWGRATWCYECAALTLPQVPRACKRKACHASPLDCPRFGFCRVTRLTEDSAALFAPSLKG